jgi:hypothetical protein
MNSSTLFTHPALAAAMLAAGFALGLAYFAALRRGVALFAAGSGVWAPLALTVARLGAAAAAMTGAAMIGAMPLLALFVGFLVARVVALRAARRVG